MPLIEAGARNKPVPFFSEAMEDYLVDIQSFMSKKAHIMEEVCCVPLNENTQTKAMIVQPPFPWESLSPADKKCNRWLSRDFHGLRWNSGDIPYERLHTILQTVLQPAERIFVKGYNKIQQLKEILPEK